MQVDIESGKNALMSHNVHLGVFCLFLLESFVSKNVNSMCSLNWLKSSQTMVYNDSLMSLYSVFGSLDSK